MEAVTLTLSLHQQELFVIASHQMTHTELNQSALGLVDSSHMGKIILQNTQYTSAGILNIITVHPHY